MRAMELSTLELVAIAMIALLVLGPEEMIRQSRRLGKFVAKLKTEANNFRIMVESEVDMKTLEGPTKSVVKASQPPPVENEVGKIEETPHAE